LQVPNESTINARGLWLLEQDGRSPWRARWSFLGLPPRYLFCHDPANLGSVDVCSECLSILPWMVEPDRLASTLSAFAYRDPIDETLKALNYRGDRYAVRLFGAPQAAAARDRPRPDVLIPVPLRPGRVCSRGFNQPPLIAKHVGAKLCCPESSREISRTRATPSQTTLHAAERRHNVEGAFIVCAEFRTHIESLGLRRVALIDDIFTTDASLDAAREALLEVSVVDVQRWAVAKAMPTKSTMPT